MPRPLWTRRHKDKFYIFDFCRNLEFFSQDVPTVDGALGASLSQRLFTRRLELLCELDRKPVESAQEGSTLDPDFPSTDREVRQLTAQILQAEVAAMNPDNFLVRPRRQLVEHYAQPDNLHSLSPEALQELSHQVAGLPTQLESEGEEPKRFQRRTVSERRAQICRHQVLSVSHLIPVQFDHLKGKCELRFRHIRDREQLAGPDQVRNPFASRVNPPSSQQTCGQLL